MPIIKIDNKEYELDSLSDEALPSSFAGDTLKLG